MRRRRRRNFLQFLTILIFYNFTDISIFSLRLLSSALLVSQAKSIGTLRDATPHAPPAIRRLHAYALSVVAVVAQLPLIQL